MIPISVKYPNLHRDHGVAVRGGISVLLWCLWRLVLVISGWKAGFMMAEMARYFVPVF